MSAAPDVALTGEPAPRWTASPGPVSRREGRLASALATARVAVPAAVIGLALAVAAFPGLFARLSETSDPRACNLAESRRGPTEGHPFGFDIQGCDLFANVVHGTRPSLFIGLTAGAGALLIAVVLGSAAAYLGGLVDAAVSRTMDIMFGFPVLVGQVVVLNTLDSRSPLVVAAVLVAFLWPYTTRLMRSAALTTVNLGYVRAARGVGAGPVRVVVRHVLPNSVGPVLAVMGISIGAIITLESALTFLGVGLQQPTISWGVQLNTARTSFQADPHLLLFPSLFLSVTVLSFVLLGDALRDRLDPRSRT